MKPATSEHDGILVVRDDLFPGGTKARFLGQLFDGADELVYASPAEGGAQTALATVAKQLGKRVVIFTADRKRPHPRTVMAKSLGAQVCMVAPGYLSVVQARARDYCRASGARLVPFGADLPQAIDAIAAAARSLNLRPTEVWCAAGSGVLSRGLAQAWPGAARHAVQVGRPLSPGDVAGAAIHRASLPFERAFQGDVPFPADRHYDAKAWAVAKEKARREAGLVVFWNVTGEPA